MIKRYDELPELNKNWILNKINGTHIIIIISSTASTAAQEYSPRPMGCQITVGELWVVLFEFKYNLFFGRIIGLHRSTEISAHNVTEPTFIFGVYKAVWQRTDLIEHEMMRSIRKAIWFGTNVRHRYWFNSDHRRPEQNGGINQKYIYIQPARHHGGQKTTNRQ